MDNKKNEEHNCTASYIDCDLYEKCFQVSTGFDLLAREVTQIKEAERVAHQKRKETHQMVLDVSNKLDQHIDDFNNHGDLEMETVRKQTQVLNQLSERVKTIHDDSLIEKQDQKWIKIIGYAMIGVILWLLIHINESDKVMVDIASDLKHNSQTLKELKGYFKGDNK
jgi:hypothetical protein